MDEQQTASPVVKKTPVEGMAFPEAIAKLIEGSRITRISWDDTTSYGVLKDGFLMIILQGEPHKWIVNDGDLFAKDWVEVNYEN